MDSQPGKTNARFPLFETAAGLLFFGQGVFWACCGKTLRLELKTLTDREAAEAGGLFLFFTGGLELAVGCVCLGVGLLLARRARRLPKWARLATLLLPAAAVVVGLLAVIKGISSGVLFRMGG